MNEPLRRLDIPMAGGPSQPGAKTCACSGPAMPKAPWILGAHESAVGPIPRIAAVWTSEDRMGEIRARVSDRARMSYRVEPGLYAVGEPTPESDVFVSANYKLSFDKLRRSLNGMHAWVLVLDTKGINVWCAAGKHTFGTEELVGRIISTKLGELVSHRRIILPQLAGPGVSGHGVMERTGFTVRFGPVDARDIPAYVAAGYKKTPEMRTVRFTFIDRLVLTPMEINPMMRHFPVYALVVLAIFGLDPSGILFKKSWAGGWPFLVLGLASVAAGAFFTPLFLPFVPSRSFAVKGWIVGVIVTAAMAGLLGIHVAGHGLLTMAFVYLFYPLLSSYIALQFTGSTTFTHMSGVKRELRIGLPLYISGSVISGLFLIAHKLMEWGFLNHQ